MFNSLNLPHWPTVRHALSVAWNHKNLWVLGLLAVAADFGGIFESVFKAMPAGELGAGFASVAGSQPFGPWVGQHLPLAGTWNSVLAMVSTPRASAVAVAAVTGVLALAVLLAVASVLALAAAALTLAVNAASVHRRMAFGEAVTLALPSFWPALGLLVAMKLAVGVPFALVASSWIRMAEDGGTGAVAVFLVAFTVASVVGVLGSLLAVIALNEVAVNRRPLLEAVYWAARKLKRHWLAALELGALLLLVSAAAYLIALAALLALAVPVIFLIALFAWLKATVIVSLLVAATVALIMLAMMVAAGFVGTAQLAAWNMFWQQLGHRTVFGHVLDFVKNLFRRK